MKTFRKNLVIIVLLLVVVFVKPRNIEAKKEGITTDSNLQPEAMGVYEKWTWHRSMSFSSPAVDDLDNDGVREVVVVTNWGSDIIWCFNQIGQVKWQREIPSVNPSSCSPLIVDLDKDGKKEIIIGSANSRLHCLGYDGEILWIYIAGGAIHSSPAAADIDDDGYLEILFGSMNH